MFARTHWGNQHICADFYVLQLLLLKYSSRKHAYLQATKISKLATSIKKIFAIFRVFFRKVYNLANILLLFLKF